MLVAAYARRMQWLAKLQAVEVWDLLGRAMQQQRRGGQPGHSAQPGQQMSASSLLREIGTEKR